MIPCSSVSAQQGRDFRELEKVALEELKETNTPGAAILIVSGDRVVFAKGFGVSDIETGTPVTPDTLFRLGVLSKIFVATVLVSLAEEGKVDLAAPVSKYVKGLSPKLSAVTAHQLLSQTAGMTEEHFRFGLWDDSALGSVVRSWKDDRVFTEPGKIFSSSHQSYDIVGLMTQEITGKRFADLMNDKIFKPLKMSRSTYRPLVAVTYPFSQGHSGRGKEGPRVVRPFVLNGVGWPSISLFSSVNDLSRFWIAFLNDGRLDGNQVLTPSVIAKLSTAYVASPVAPGEEVGYGGLHFSSNGRYRVLSETSSWAGIHTLERIVPEERFAIVILANGANLRKTAEKAMQMFLPAQTRSDARVNLPLPMTSAEASSYVGTYENERVMTLLLKDGRLFLREDTPAGRVGTLPSGVELPVTKVGEHYFIATAPGASEPLAFGLVIGGSGKAEFLHVGNRALKRR